MATLRLITQKRTLGFKLETTPYTAENLAEADYCYSVYDISYSPEVETYARKLARGDFSRDVSVSGRRKLTISFKVDLHSGDAVTTAPEYFDMLRACAMKQTSYGATGIDVVTDSTQDRTPATIEVVERQEGESPKQLVIKARGSMGNARIVSSQVGQPVAMEFEFQGALDGITTRAYGSIIDPTAFDTALPDAVLGATINLYATTQFLNGFTIDLGNTVEVFTDPSKADGYEGARVVDRNPTLELDPDMLVTDDINWYSNQTTNTTGALSIDIGGNLHINAPVAQVTNSYQPEEREGHITNKLTLELKRSTNGDDELQIIQGTEA